LRRAAAVVVVVAPMAAEPGVSLERAGVAIESPGTCLVPLRLPPPQWRQAAMVLLPPPVMVR
jgi:hypothetical protein